MARKDSLHKEHILRGMITLLILRMLSENPMHGYSLQLMIAEKTKREMPQGTIYVLLKSLERRGLITLFETRAERDKKLYTISEKGRTFLLGHKEPLAIARDIMDGLIEYINGETDKKTE